MSLYTHRCETCGHRSYEHDANRCRWYSHCDCTDPQFGPSVLVPTFTGNGETVDRVIPPGEGIRSQKSIEADDSPQGWHYKDGPGGVIVPSCDCVECQALYEAAS